MLFVKQSRIAAPPTAVFAFHESPGALLRLTPPGVRVELVRDDGTLHVGSRVHLRVGVGPIKVNWLAELAEYDPPHGFADRQVSGPFRHWYHRHRFLDDGAGGTLMRDEVEYELPGGPLGFVMAKANLPAKLEAAFSYRHEKTRQLVEAGAWPQDRVDEPGIAGGFTAT